MSSETRYRYRVQVRYSDSFESFATRDAAVDRAEKLSRQTSNVVSVTDYGQVPPRFIGQGLDGKFIWHPDFKGPYT